MARRRNDGIVGRILLWFVGAFVVIGTVAGIKFVIEKDFGGSEEPSQIVPIPSETPPVSDDSATSDEPGTSTEPDTSEEPEPEPEVMPLPLYDGPYSDLTNQGILDLSFGYRPEGMSAAAFQPYEGIMLVDTDLYGELELGIISNSIRWHSGNEAFRLGFGTNFDKETTNKTYEEFYGNGEDTPFKYASAFIYNFTIKPELLGSDGYSYSIFIINKTEGLEGEISLFYRSTVDEGWVYYDTKDTNDFDGGPFDNTQYEENEYQVALVFQTNNKSKYFDLKPTIAVSVQHEPLDPQPEGLYRLQVQSDNEYFTHLKTYEWGGYELEWQQEFEHGEAYSIIDFKVDSQYDNEFVFITTTANGPGEEMSDYQLIKVFANGVDEVFIESPTQGHQNIHLLEGVNTMTIVELSGGGCSIELTHRPFYAFDLNY